MYEVATFQGVHGSFLFLFLSAVNTVPPLTRNFWHAVAREMGTGHTPKACQAKYTENFQVPHGRRAAAKPNPNPLSISGVTSRRGTMKRRRQFREAMSHLDKGCSDDVFDSTPLKKWQKPLRVS